MTIEQRIRDAEAMLFARDALEIDEQLVNSPIDRSPTMAILPVPDWDWQVEPDDDGSRITVGVDLNPATFWRKHLLAHLRRPALRREITECLHALGASAEY